MKMIILSTLCVSHIDQKQRRFKQANLFTGGSDETNCQYAYDS